MGKLRVLSGREVCKILGAEGFTEVRQRGSHIVMQKRSRDGDKAHEVIATSAGVEGSIAAQKVH